MDQLPNEHTTLGPQEGFHPAPCPQNLPYREGSGGIHCNWKRQCSHMTVSAERGMVLQEWYRQMEAPYRQVNLLPVRRETC
jgi:hypothetical protein